MYFRKITPKIINSEDFEKFDIESLISSSQSTLREEGTDYRENP